MQKLIWKNANGEELNLTSGNYGITNWEGFANTSLNIQSQQVPFQDGGVFLDALMEQRELSVTLAMNDGGNLETRYRLRRELIHILNPKLGEGYLIYTNDFISKRIKCVAQIPLFETHNSNDSGTPKASLAWTACEPYWEDLEETELKLNIGERKTVINNGDIPTPVKIKTYTVNATDEIIKNITQDSYIKIEGVEEASLEINTELGNKQILEASDDKSIKNWALLYSCSTSNGIITLVGVEGGYIASSKNLIDWQYVLVGSDIKRLKFINKKNIFIAIDYMSLYESNDGKAWNLAVGNLYANSIAYSEELDLYVSVGDSGEIKTSTNLVEWTLRTSGTNANLYDVEYIDNLEMFVAVGGSVIVKSADGLTWQVDSRSVTGDLKHIISSDNGIIIATGNKKIIRTYDGLTWENVYNSEKEIKDCCYSSSLDMFVLCGENKVIYSFDTDSWIEVAIDNIDYLYSVIYISYQSKFLLVGNNGFIAQSTNGEIWEQSSIGVNTQLKKIIYSEKQNKTVAVGQNVIIVYEGSECRVINIETTLNDIIYVEKYDIYLAGSENGKIYKSINAYNWDIINIGNYAINKIIYSEKQNIFVAVGNHGTLIKSLNGEIWESITISTTKDLYSIVYCEQLNMFVGVGSLVIVKSEGIDNWVISNITSYLHDIDYSENANIFIACGSAGEIRVSQNGIDWNVENSGTSQSLSGVKYIKEIGSIMVVGYYGTILESYDGKYWKNINFQLYNSFSNVNYCNGEINIVGDRTIIVVRKLSYNKNVINKLSKESDMNFNLSVGENELLFSTQKGSAFARVTYRQKYIGV